MGGADNNRFPAVLLAGGLSTRMGFPKLLLKQDGRLCASRIIEDLREAGWGRTAVVVSTGDLMEFVKLQLPSAEAIFNPEPARGMISSLRLALDWAEGGAEGLLALPVDHPLVTRETLRKLRSQAAPEWAAVPEYRGQRGHPTWWGRAAWRALRSAEADEGANQVLRRYDIQIRLLPVDDPRILVNINAPEDMERYHLQPYRIDR